MRLLAATALLLVAAAPVPVRDIDRAGAARAVEALAASLDGYIDPARVRAVQARLRAERPRLQGIASREALVEALNAILAASGDLHLKARIDSVVDAGAAPAALTDAQEALLERQLAHGLLAVRRLPGNVGYLKMRYFAPDADGARFVDAAMAMLADSAVLIIDLRENTGGGGAADERLLGHLSATPIPMAAIHWRAADGRMSVEQRRAATIPGGPLYPTRPILVLTARRTFSAAEGFAYDLKAAGRATLVGERTRGGANPSNRNVLLGNGISAFVPNGRVEHPTTHGNWEGTGVTPDVPTAPADALVEAYRRALPLVRLLVDTPKARAELAAALADPAGTLRADAGL